MTNTFPLDVQKRIAYLDKVGPFIGKQLIKVFTGQRRVGKSYLLFQIMDLIREKDNKAKICYINKENLDFDFIKTEKDLHNYVKANKSGKTSVFIDEIQEIVGFEDALRSLVLDEDLDIYCTGSNANLLSSDISGRLSGRFIEITVYSLSYPEFLSFHQLTESEDALEKYMKYGGLPYLKHLPLMDGIVFEYLKNVYGTIIYRDIINRHAIRNVRFLEQLVQFLASNTGSLFSAKKISDYLKAQKMNVGANQVLTYIHHLTQAFLIHKVQRYDIAGKRVFETLEKYYFENLGIRNGIWGYRPEERGKIIENIVYNHLICKGYNVKIGIVGSEEIDFVCEKQGEKRYVQVALTIQQESTLQREFGNLQKIKDNYPKYVVTLDAFQGNTVKGIEHLHLRKFLTEFT